MRIECLGQVNTVYKKCPCIEKQEREEISARAVSGRQILRNEWRAAVGLRLRSFGYTFDTLTPREGQKGAFEAAQGVAAKYIDPTCKSDEGLILTGAVGCGKSMLSAAICNHIIDNTDIADIVAADAAIGVRQSGSRAPSLKYVSTTTLLAEIKAAYDDKTRSAQGYIDTFARTRLLVLDDLGAERMTEWSRERLFEIIDYRYSTMKPIIVTTNLVPAALKEAIGDRNFDRLKTMCVLVNIDTVSQRTIASM